MSYLCTNGHPHKQQINTINCSFCRENDMKRQKRLMAKIRTNAALPPRLVRHADLNLSEPGMSCFRVQAPCCKHGVLLLRRDPKTLKLLAEDACISCGTRFKYLDIRRLRRIDSGKEQP